MYVRPNYDTKAALRKALAMGDRVEIFQPGLGTTPSEGVVSVEGPHAPRPHTWYARVKVEGGRVTKVLQ